MFRCLPKLCRSSSLTAFSVKVYRVRRRRRQGPPYIRASVIGTVTNPPRVNAAVRRFRVESEAERPCRGGQILIQENIWRKRCGMNDKKGNKCVGILLSVLDAPKIYFRVTEPHAWNPMCFANMYAHTLFLSLSFSFSLYLSLSFSGGTRLERRREMAENGKIHNSSRQ